MRPEPVYAPPVARLLTMGRELASRAAAPDYVALGLSAADVPELLRMAADPALHEASSQSEEVYAPIHAWRALGQLRAAEAAEPLLRVLEERHDDDWVSEGIPEVLGMIGPAALEPAAALLARAELVAYPFLRVAAARSVAQVAHHHPDSRDRAVAILTRQLEAWKEQSATLNAFLVSYLIDLRALEAVPMMWTAFAGKAVDLSVAGDWEDVQVELGLISARTTPRSPPPWLALAAKIADARQAPPAPSRASRTPPAARRAQKASRKRNRKRR